MEYINYVYIGIPVVLIILGIVFWPKKKKTTVEVNDELIKGIFNSIGKENIVNVESELSRVKIDVTDLESIDFDALKEISEGVFISGKSLKIMFKDSADNIVNRMREGL